MKPISLLNRQEKRAILVLSGIVFASRAALALIHGRKLFGTLIVDDAFYAMSIARNLALGHGFTADGIHLTNGVQPLITVLYSASFWLVGDNPNTQVRVVLILGALIEASFVWVIAGFLAAMDGRQKRPEWWRSPAVIAAAMQAVLFTLFVHFESGLETGLYSLLIVLVLLQYARLRMHPPDLDSQRMPHPHIWGYIWLGFLCGLMVLARIDAAMLVVILALTLIREKSGLRNAAVVSITALVVSGPWWLFNLTQFGNLMPMSGQAESLQKMPPDAVPLAVSYLTDIFFLYPHLWRQSISQGVYNIAALSGVILLAVLIRRYGVWKAIRSGFEIKVLSPLLWFSAFLLIYYPFFFGAPWFMHRYFQPIRLLWLIVLAIGLPILIANMVRMNASFRTLRQAAVVVAIIAIFLINIRMDRSLYLPPGPSDLARVGFWAQTQPQSSIAMMQSGIAGFLSPNVTNMDGKVNPEALQALQHGTLGDYIRRQHFDYLADMPPSIDTMVATAERAGVRYSLIDSIHIVKIYRR